MRLSIITITIKYATTIQFFSCYNNSDNSSFLFTKLKLKIKKLKVRKPELPKLKLKIRQRVTPNKFNKKEGHEFFLQKIKLY